MEEILTALKTIQNDLDNQRQEIRETGKTVTEQVTKNISMMFEEKFSAINKNLEDVKEKMEIQEKGLQNLERQARKNNLVFFGLEESEKSYENLERNFITWVEQYLSVKINNCDIQEIKRIGKKGEKPRPLVVTFLTLGTKIKILKQKRALIDTTYYFKEDYPKQVLEKRKKLQAQLQLEREKGNMAKISYDKLIISKVNPKRKLPISPENAMPTNTEKIQINKKNKIQQGDQSVKRSSSFSEGIIKQGILNYVVKNSTSKKNNDNKQI
ncbi:uncharacterized protein LOC111364821 [Spodoptera litura]|uniref:Uncharacterized protein LOC111364821 n=1 Tax=Spodoptera litura TaxID=69820 RepID=A0A9J7EXS2_SPOLT|nr:uncharacterized protein LOC111364821 [Spodoptera litura]